MRRGCSWGERGIGLDWVSTFRGEISVGFRVGLGYLEWGVILDDEIDLCCCWGCIWVFKVRVGVVFVVGDDLVFIFVIFWEKCYFFWGYFWELDVLLIN